MPDPLLSLLIRRINRTGPMTAAEYMAEALHHRGQGYYAAGDPLGTAGDFVTAPEISQMFGELLGSWMVANGLGAGELGTGASEPPCLVELGPGRGTLMADMIRVINTVAPVQDILQVHLVESNPSLRAAQALALPTIEVVWHDDLSTLPDRPWFLIANEFFDALPIHQLIWSEGAWRESLVVTDPAGTGLAWGMDRAPSPLAMLLPSETRETAREGAIAELCPAATAMMTAIAGHIVTHGGAALLIDYGGERDAAGRSLQAVRDHQPADPLRDPGRADLSSHVDFSEMRRAARTGGAEFHGPVDQGNFLTALGINQRATGLRRNATTAQRRDIENAVHRLIDPKEMGTLFKVAAIMRPEAPTPAGFE
jgi:NADH dehydrogenase [ubiquinone] 1 alpha subcomplex assembly factor 7